MSELLGYFVITVLEIVPLWKIFRKTGQSPALSLFVIVPLFGHIVVALVFGKARWPSFPSRD